MARDGGGGRGAGARGGHRLSRPGGPIVTATVTARAVAAANAFMARTLAAAASRPQPPWGLAVRRFGEAVAVAAPGAPDLDFVNSVYGLGPADAGRLPALAEHYAALGVRPWFELAPGPGFGELAAALTRAGAAQIGFHTALVREPGDVPAASPRVSVRGVGEHEIEQFAEVLLRGHEVPADARATALGLYRPWPSVDGLTLRLAELEGEPAGAGALFVSEGAAYLANAATLPEQRRRGVQTALVADRMAAASAAGCDLLCALAAFDSASSRNLQRAGFRIACTLARWRVGGE